MRKKMGAIILALLLAGGVVNVQAVQEPLEQAVVASEGISPRYLLISSIHGNTTVLDGSVYSTGTVSGDCTYAKVTITLQNFKDGKWQNVCSWSATGEKSATKSANTKATPGMIYRTKIYGYVSKGETTDSTTLYTKVVGA